MPSPHVSSRGFASFPVICASAAALPWPHRVLTATGGVRARPSRLRECTRDGPERLLPRSIRVPHNNRCRIDHTIRFRLSNKQHGPPHVSRPITDASTFRNSSPVSRILEHLNVTSRRLTRDTVSSNHHPHIILMEIVH